MGFKVKLLILVVANVAVPVAVMFPPIALVKFKLVMLAKVAVRLDIVAVKAFSKLVNRFVEVALVVTKSVMVALAILRPVTVAPDKCNRSSSSIFIYIRHCSRSRYTVLYFS